MQWLDEGIDLHSICECIAKCFSKNTYTFDQHSRDLFTSIYCCLPAHSGEELIIPVTMLSGGMELF